MDCLKLDVARFGVSVHIVIWGIIIFILLLLLLDGIMNNIYISLIILVIFVYLTFIHLNTIEFESSKKKLLV